MTHKFDASLNSHTWMTTIVQEGKLKAKENDNIKTESTNELSKSKKRKARIRCGIRVRGSTGPETTGDLKSPPEEQVEEDI